MNIFRASGRAAGYKRTVIMLAVCLLLALASQRAPAESFTFTPPTPAELAMTSEPKAPGAPAIILSYEEIHDGEAGQVLVHLRIKILTEAGFEAGNVEIPGLIDANHLGKNFFARTIHSDGKIFSFVSDPGNTHMSVVEKTNVGVTAALPDVGAGSIVEYAYRLGRDYGYGGAILPPWLLQRQYFVRSLHFSLKLNSIQMERVHWVAKLPDGVEVKRNKNSLSLDASDVPAAPYEEFTPPAFSFLYNVRFFSWWGPQDNFWGYTASSRDQDWSTFYRPPNGLVKDVRALVPSGDSDEIKLRKLYDIVQQFENTDLTRIRTQREDKQSSVKEVRNSEDIWKRKRGGSEDLTLLFVALARAAGLQAYPMAVASRDEAIFNRDVLSWSQLDSVVAVVISNGQVRFFDPGVRRCPFGYLAPWHSNVAGVSIEDKVARFRSTAADFPKASRTTRAAEITIDPTGAITGTIRISWYGLAGLGLRRVAVRDGEPSVRSAVEQEIQASLPSGVEVKLQSLDPLADPNALLVAKFTVTGKLGVATSKRLIVPAQFFAVSEKAILAAKTRVAPVAFPAAYIDRDQFVLHLSAGLTAETLPEPRSLSFGGDSAIYKFLIEHPSKDKPLVATQRDSTINRLDYTLAEYGALHEFFSKIASYDQDQIVLQIAPSTSSN